MNCLPFKPLTLNFINLKKNLSKIDKLLKIELPKFGVDPRSRKIVSTYTIQ